MKKISKDWILTISLSVIVVLILIIDTVWYYFWEVKNQQEIAQVEEKIEVINSFSDYARKLKIRRKENSAEWYRTIETLKNGDNITIKIDNEGNAYFELSGKLEKKYGSEYKVVEKSLICQKVVLNQDDKNYFFFITEDGALKVITVLEEEIKEESEDYKKYRNIVNIITEIEENAELGYINKIKLFDISGNVFEI